MKSKAKITLAITILVSLLLIFVIYKEKIQKKKISLMKCIMERKNR